MSVKDYLKIINIQDLTTGDIAKSIPLNHDSLVTINLPFYELELLLAIIDILRDEHNVCLKIGYKG